MKRIIVALVVGATVGCPAHAALTPVSPKSPVTSPVSPREPGFAVARAEEEKKEKRARKKADDVLVTQRLLEYDPAEAAAVISVEAIHEQIDREKILLIRQYIRKFGDDVLNKAFPERVEEIQAALDAVVPAELPDLRRLGARPQHLGEGLVALDKKRDKQFVDRAAVVEQQLPRVLAAYNQELQINAYRKHLGATQGAVVVDPTALDAVELRDRCFKSVYESCKAVITAIARAKDLTIEKVTELLTPLADLVGQNSELLLADDERLDDATREAITKKVEAIRKKVADIVEQISNRNLKIEDVSKPGQRAQANRLLDVCNQILRGLRVPDLDLVIEMDTKGDFKIAQRVNNQLRREAHEERQALVAQDVVVARRLQEEEDAKRRAAEEAASLAFALRLQAEDEAAAAQQLQGVPGGALAEDEAYARQVQDQLDREARGE